MDQKKNITRFLIIRFSSIGDIVLTTPVIRCLKQQVAGAEVHYLTKKSYRTILASNPYIDQLHFLEDSWSETIKPLQKAGFDYIIDLHHNLRTMRIKLGLRKVKSFSFDKLNMGKWLLTNLKINRLPTLHIVDRYLATTKTFGVTNDGNGLDYFIPKEDEVPFTALPTSHQAGYIGLVIGAAYATKQLPVHKLKELCNLIEHPVILLGGPEDKQAGDEIAMIDPVKIYNACGKFNLNESADLVRKSKLIITHDTGLMHIAAAFRKKILSVWGNTVPEFGMTPYYGNHPVNQSLFEIKDLYCRPCSKIGYKKCPQKHFKCMEMQDMQLIKSRAEKEAL